MADIVFITPDFAVASQLAADDFALVAAMGIKSVINNRPDEEQGLPINSEQAETAARKHGLNYTYLPATHHDLLEQGSIDGFDAASRAVPGPVLAYCRTGNRSSILWALASAKRGSVKDILRKLTDVGLDIDFLEAELQEQSERTESVEMAL